MTDTQPQTHNQSTTGHIALSGAMLMAISNAPTEVLERHQRELMRAIGDHTDEMRAAAWGGIGIEDGVRYHMAATRKRLAEAELSAIAAELDRRTR